MLGEPAPPLAAMCGFCSNSFLRELSGLRSAAKRETDFAFSTLVTRLVNSALPGQDYDCGTSFVNQRDSLSPRSHPMRNAPPHPDIYEFMFAGIRMADGG